MNMHSILGQHAPRGTLCAMWVEIREGKAFDVHVGRLYHFVFAIPDQVEQLQDLGFEELYGGAVATGSTSVCGCPRIVWTTATLCHSGFDRRPQSYQGMQLAGDRTTTG
jgi:hypothetical protein